MFELYISYSQIAIFDSSLENPFNDWNPVQVKQGFVWREGSVAFRTLDEVGGMKIDVRLCDEPEKSSHTIRSIKVPFKVPCGIDIEVGSITESKKLALPSGNYSLVFDTWYDNRQMVCRFSFCKKMDMQPEVLILDQELDPQYPLDMNGIPA